ncbi:LOW QUALITY PROTEIN: microfibrillar-associated protein 1A-like [Ptychodera flava]|uniref:LOW QUALITY PROTEIN: microfibrillar-associated protein 1A-like n=1 Tax=Ptychodera flava TaxID=63121 RepID=UPI00396A469E
MDSALASLKAQIQSTAGAIPIRNEKGELTMQKVKVQRYVSGKRPDYAPESSDEEEEELEVAFIRRKKTAQQEAEQEELNEEEEDRRLQRIRQRHRETEDHEAETRTARHTELPEILSGSEGEDDDEDDYRRRPDIEMEESSEEEEEELEEDEIERRRSLMKQRARERMQMEEEVMDVGEEEEEHESEEESSEYEEYSDSEEETGPRLKPVFVAKKDRITIQEKEIEAKRRRELENEARKLAEERKKQSIKMVEDEARKELQQEQNAKDPSDVVQTDDENDEEEYEAWKVRELKRIKRAREEREQMEKERLEVDRLRNMTEEERRAEARNNPKVVTNKAQKGKYRFLQKYYHRGAFFLDKEETVFKQDFSSPTLEDHFDKSVLPKVMQVKNFGRSGRTKYTHLVDQDTTQFDSPWASDTTMNLKFQNAHAAGLKQSFDKPTSRKRKKLT